MVLKQSNQPSTERHHKFNPQTQCLSANNYQLSNKYTNDLPTSSTFKSRVHPTMYQPSTYTSISKLKHRSLCQHKFHIDARFNKPYLQLQLLVQHNNSDRINFFIFYVNIFRVFIMSGFANGIYTFNLLSFNSIQPPCINIIIIIQIIIIFMFNLNNIALHLRSPKKARNEEI